jgi:hypothetical protein
VLGGEREASAPGIAQEVLTRDAVLDRRAHRSLALLEIDGDHHATPPERFRHAAEEPRAVREVMVAVHDEHDVADARRQVGIVASAQDRRHVPHPGLHQPEAKAFEVRQARIDRVDATARADGAGEGDREVARPGAHVRDDGAAPDAESGHDAPALLPPVTRRIEHAAHERLEVRRAEAIVGVTSGLALPVLRGARDGLRSPHRS